jgi:hypothetical protein
MHRAAAATVILRGISSGHSQTTTILHTVMFISLQKTKQDPTGWTDFFLLMPDSSKAVGPHIACCRKNMLHIIVGYIVLCLSTGIYRV